MNRVYYCIHDNFDNCLNYFIRKKKGFKIITTGKSLKITDVIDKESYIFATEHIGQGLLNLIVRTKIEVKNKIKDKNIVSAVPQYFLSNKNYFKRMKGHINNVTEIDLSKAYLNSALKLDFIGLELYQKLYNVTGSSRKRILGSLATRKQIETYSPDGILIKKEIQQDKILKDVWNNICAFTDVQILQIMNNNNPNKFIFYWVDNIFFSDIKNFFTKNIIVPYGIEYKSTEHSYLTYEHKRANLILVELNDGREFNLRI